MKPEITVIRRFTAHNAQCEAMCEGLKAIGVPFSYNKTMSQPVITRKISMWGWKVGREFREKGHGILVMEMGYIGDRKKYISLGWNGLNGHASFPEYPDDNGERFRAIGGELRPWKEPDDKKPVLILGQFKGDASLYGFDGDIEYSKWARELLKRGERVLYRPHPESLKHPTRSFHVRGAGISTGSLQQALDEAKYVIGWNSNSLLDAVLNGTPAVAMDKGSMVYELAGKGIGDIITPDRTEWAHRIAFTQWTLEEISTGKPLIKLFGGKI